MRRSAGSRRGGAWLLAALCVVALSGLAGCQAAQKRPAENPLTSDLIDYRNALRALQEGRIDEAIVILQRARMSYPAEPNIPNALGLAMLYRKDGTSAVKAFDEALKLNPGFHEARNNRGVAYLELNKLDEAEADIQKVLDDGQPSDKLTAHYNMGLLFGKRLKWVDAEREFSLVIADDPQNLKSYRERGLARMKSQDFRGALDDFLHLLKEEPRDEVANYNAALCLLTSGRRDLAVRYMERAAEAAPDSQEGKKARRFLDGERASRPPSSGAP